MLGKAIGDWIIYREPRRAGGRSGYVAVAKLQQIDPDPDMPDHSYARVADFLPFDVVVPLQRASGFYERQLAFVIEAVFDRGKPSREVRTHLFLMKSLLRSLSTD